MGHPNLSPELNRMIEEAQQTKWLNIENLKEGDILEVHTRNTVYTFEITNPKEGGVKVKSTSERYPIENNTDGIIYGTTLSGTGTMLKLRHIATGLKMSIGVQKYGELILSTTQKILLNGNEIIFNN